MFFVFFLFFRIRLAFEAIFRKSATLQDVDPDPEMGSSCSVSTNRPDGIDQLNEASPRLKISSSPTTSKKVQLVS